MKQEIWGVCVNRRAEYPLWTCTTWLGIYLMKRLMLRVVNFPTYGGDNDDDDNDNINPETNSYSHAGLLLMLGYLLLNL